MIARVDGEVVSPEMLWWPEMNFDQFRWPGRIGAYELEIPSTVFVEGLKPAYQQCAAELRADDLHGTDPESPLTAAAYPSLEELLHYPAALFEAVGVYLWSDLLGKFLVFRPQAARFMVNSIEAVSASSSVVVVRGRGYHGAPGFAAEGKQGSSANWAYHPGSP